MINNKDEDNLDDKFSFSQPEGEDESYNLHKEMINIEFENITESFMKKYHRYSDIHKEIEMSKAEDEERKFQSVGNNMNKSPFEM